MVIVLSIGGEGKVVGGNTRINTKGSDSIGNSSIGVIHGISIVGRRDGESVTGGVISGDEHIDRARGLGESPSVRRIQRDSDTIGRYTIDRGANSDGLSDIDINVGRGRLGGSIIDDTRSEE